MIETVRENNDRPMDSYVDAFNDISMNMRNSQVLPQIGNLNSSSVEFNSQIEIPTIVQKYSAINTQKSNRDLEGIERFLDRDLNKSDMILSKKNRQRYQEYLKNFKGKSIVPGMEVYQHSLMRLSEADPDHYQRIMKLKYLKEQTMIQLNKEQIHARKLDKQHKHKIGFDENFMPHHKNGLLTSRFGKLIKQSFQLEDLDNVSER